MKTIEDIKALLPEVYKMMYDTMECGRILVDEVDGGSNSCFFEKDGWEINVYYICQGYYYYMPQTYWEPSEEGFTKAWCEVSEIEIIYHDDNEGDQVFENEVLLEIAELIDKEMEDVTWNVN
jgi:hypothetical protein